MRIQNRTAILVVIALASYLPPFLITVLSISAPSIGLDFGASTSSLTWLINALIICSVSLALPFGRLGDLTSRRAMLVIGFVIFTVTSVVIYFVPNLGWLIALRVIQGVGSACTFSTTQAILADTFPPEQRGRVLGISIAAGYTGLASAPAIGGLLTNFFGWRSVFIFIAVWSAVAVIAGIMTLPPNSKPRPAKSLRSLMDIPGCLYFFLATCSLAFGLNKIPQAYGFALVVLGAVFGVIFIIHEKRVKMPLLSMRLFSQGPNFLLSSLASLLNYCATFAVSYLLAIYLQQAMGLSSALAGLVLITTPLIQAVLSPIAGRLSDKYSPFVLATSGMVICGLSLVMLAFISAQTPLWYIFIALTAIGIGYAVFSSPNMNAIMSNVPREDSGIAVSFVATMRNLGQLISMAVIAVVMILNIGDTPILTTTPTQIVSITRTSFIILIIFSIVGVFTSMNRRSAKPPTAEAGSDMTSNS